MFHPFPSTLDFKDFQVARFSQNWPDLGESIPSITRIASMHNIIRIIRDDAGNAGGVVQY